MTALVAVRRRWTSVALTAGVVALLALVLLGWVGADTLRNSTEGRPADTLPPPVALPPTPAALLAVRDDDGALTSLAVLALAPPDADGVVRGGTLLPIPVGAAVQDGPDSRWVRMADVYEEGGLPRLADAASAMLMINFSLIAEVDEETLATLLRPVGEVDVLMPGDVIDTDTNAVAASDDAGDIVVVGSGPADIDAARGAAVLAAWDEATPEGSRFEQRVVYWGGLSERIGDGLPVRVSREPTASMADFFSALTAGPTQVYALRGTPITTIEENPEGLDMYRLDTAETMLVMATVVPDAVSPVEVAFSVQLINPFGDPALTRAAVERLALQGVGVGLVRPDLAGIEIPDVTEFSLGSGSTLAEVQPYLDSLGATQQVPLGANGTPHGRVQDIDVTVVLGQSFVDLLARQAPGTTTSSVTTVEDTNDTSDTTEASG